MGEWKERKMVRLRNVEWRKWKDGGDGGMEEMAGWKKEEMGLGHKREATRRFASVSLL